jgi:hypothetical protein
MTLNHTSNILDFRTEGARVGSSRPCSPVPVVKISQRTDAVVRGLIVVLKHHGAHDEITVKLKEQLEGFLNSFDSEAVWLKHIKYILTYPLAKYLRNELPPPPPQAWSPRGDLRAWMKQRLCCFNRKNTHLWYSWLQAKRSSLPASDEIVQATYDKHLSTLTKEDPGLENKKTVSRILNNKCFSKVLKDVAAQVAINFDGKDSFHTFSPSRSACFENARSKLGSLGELRYLTGRSNISGNLNANLNPSELHSMKCFAKVYNSRFECFEYQKVIESRIPYGSDDWDDLPRMLRSIDLSDELSCTIQGILEPMKVRVISKGNALEYYSMKPLQKSIHSAIRHMPPFRLTGQTFDVSMMLDLVKRACPTDEWFSVDYSAATDGLSWLYSGAIFQRIIAELPIEVQAAAWKVLGPHKLHYPIEIGKPDVVYKGTMTNGQLMGSPLSFPILCLANLGVYLDVTQEHHCNWSNFQRLNHVLINGDDMVYAAPPKLWNDHVRVAGEVGLEMSVGKAYKHSVYANVNSTSVHLDLKKFEEIVLPEPKDTSSFEEGLKFIEKYRKPAATPWRIDYLNTGLFFGQRKVQGNSEEPTKTSDEGVCKGTRFADDEYFKKLVSASGMEFLNDNGKCSSLNLLLEGALPGKQGDILKQFLSIHKKDIREETTAVFKPNSGSRSERKLTLFTRNLFFPISSGGMGINAPPRWTYKVKPDQINVARTLQARACMEANLPRNGFEPLEYSDPSAPWHLVLRDAEILGIRSEKEISKGFRKEVKRQLTKVVYPCVETRSCLIL